MHKSFFLTAGLTLGGFLTLSAPRPGWAVQAGEVEGNVVVRFADQGEDWVALEAETPLEKGDQVRVGEGGRCSLVTEDGDVVELEDGSETEIGEAAPKSFSLKLFLGGLLAKVAPDPQKKFRVQTPAAVAAVRGTEFALDVVEDGSTEVGVTEGQVAVQSADAQGAASGEESTVGANEGVEAGPQRPIKRFRNLPPRAQKRLLRMAHLRGRAPELRKRWRSLPPEKRREIRRGAAQKWRTLSPEHRQKYLGKMRREWRAERRRQPSRPAVAPRSPSGRPKHPLPHPRQPRRR